MSRKLSLLYRQGTTGAVLATLTTVAGGAGLSASPALAQQATAAATTEQPAEAEAIVVTARKRAETLQDVSAPLSVVDSSILERRQVNDVNGLQTVVPTVTIGETVGMLKINVRGLGNTTNTRSEDSDVVMYVDGAVVSRMEAQALAFFDLERVEVLRGPQGTLYGRNSTGGTINVITRKPTDDFEGYASATLGNYNLVKLEAAVGGPLTDKISARAAVTSTQRGGFGKNIATGNDIEDQKRYAARLHLLFRPTDRIRFLLSGEYGKQDDSSGLFGYLAPLFPFNPTFVPRGAGGYSDPNSRDLASSYDPRLKRDTWSVTGTFDWELSDSLSLRNVTNYRKLNFFLAQDLDVSTVNNATFVTIPLHDKQFSEEFQLNYETDKINAIAGLFYFKEVFRGQTNLGTGPTTGIFFVLQGKSTTDAFAPFFNVAYNLTDAIKLRVGGRYSTEKRTIINDSFLNGVRITTDNDIADDTRRISKYTGEYGVDWKISRDAMVYATYSQGFRSGAALIMQSGAGIIDPTTVDNYELGVKYGNRNLFANLAVFTAKTKNLQRTQATVTALGVLNTKVNNVNSLKTKGVELEAGWSPTRNLRLGGSVAWLEAKFQDFVSDDPIIQGTNLVQVAGNTTNQAPRWKWNANAEYTVPFANGSSLVASANVSYQSKVYFDEFNRPPFVETAYALLDANVTYNFVGDKLSVSIWGKNLTNQDRFADLAFSANGQAISKQWVPPRTVGATLRYEF
mgnify:CR=1 FL=1